MTKDKIYKTKEDKLNELIQIYKKLDTLGFNDDIPAIKEFKCICNKYLRDESSVGYDGNLKLDGYQRVLYYRLPMKKDTDITVNLKFNKFV